MMSPTSGPTLRTINLSTAIISQETFSELLSKQQLVASMGDRAPFVITDVVDALITHIAFVVQMESDLYIGAYVDTRGYS